MISAALRLSCISFAIYLCGVSFAETTQPSRPLAQKVIDAENVTREDNHFGDFQVIQSNVLHINNVKIRTKRNDAFALSESSQNSTSALVDSEYRHKIKKKKKKKPKKKKKKKKDKKDKHSLMNKIKHMFPKFMKKMMPMMKGPTMFMLGMAQANLNNFVMHAVMMSKMALGSVIMMIIRELVFGDKDEPVKYYNFGYDPPNRRVVTTYKHSYDYKRRRRRNL